MERGLILLVATMMVFVAPGVRGTDHLSFASNTEVNITRDGCGDSKLCVETPDDCDPAGNDTCLFASVFAYKPMPPNGTELSVELSGPSMGYIALGLTMNASEGITMLFICAQDNGTFFFRTMNRNNTDGSLYATETIVTEIRGMVKYDLIQCKFDIPNVNATMTRTAHSTTFTILLGSGTVNDGREIGPFTANLTTGPLNIADPGSNIPTAAPNTTAMTTVMTTSGANGALHPHAVLLLLSVLTLSFLKTA